MAKFFVTETIHLEHVRTVRVGTTAEKLGVQDVRKFVKLTADSRFELAAVGDPVEAYFVSSDYDASRVANVTYDGYAIGGVSRTGWIEVLFDGSQAAGTGAIAAGDYVVVGTVTPAGTANANINGMSGQGPAKVRKATDQAAAAAGPFKARVVSLGEAGTGAVGTAGVIELF